MQLRKYQQNAVDETMASLMFGSDKIIITMPTGSGKSLVISELAKQLDGSVSIVVNIEPLINQIAEHLYMLGVEYSILKSGRESEFDETKRVHLIMSQTLYARLDTLTLTSDYLLIDEIHIAYRTKRYNATFDKLKPKAVIGLSATPYDKLGYKLDDDVEMINTVTTKELIDYGFLSKVKYYIPKWSEEVDYSSVSKNGADYNITELEMITNKDTYLDNVVGSMNMIGAKDKKTLIFCSSIEQCDLITQKLKENGYCAEAYHSKVNKKDLEKIIYAFKTNSDSYRSSKLNEEVSLFNQKQKELVGLPVKCLVSVSKLSVGFDVKDIQLGVNIRPTKIRSLYYQIGGRVIRASDGKEYGEFLDCAKCVSNFGFLEDTYEPPDKDDREKLIEVNKKLSLSKLGSMITEPIKNISPDIYAKELKVLTKLEDNIFDGSLEPDDKTMLKIFKTTDDMYRLIYAGAYLYQRTYGRPISKNGKRYSYDAGWLSELALEAIEKYPIKKEHWIKAYRTRIRKLIKENKNFNSIRFFIEWLVEQYELENGLYKPTEPEPIDYGIDDEMSEIPF